VRRASLKFSIFGSFNPARSRAKQKSRPTDLVC
jgi:hypothetical protein